MLTITGMPSPAGASESDSGRSPTVTASPTAFGKPPATGMTVDPNLTPPASTVPWSRFIAGDPMKPATKAFTGSVVERARRIALLKQPVLHDGDAVSHGHRLDLVVRDVERRDPELALQRCDLGSRGDAKLRIEVRERLVHQEDARLADDRAAHRDPLALPARELARLPLEEVLDVEDLRRCPNALGDLGLRYASPSAAQSPCSAPRSCADTARSSGTPSRCRGRAAEGSPRPCRRSGSRPRRRARDRRACAESSSCRNPRAPRAPGARRRGPRGRAGRPPVGRSSDRSESRLRRSQWP